MEVIIEKERREKRAVLEEERMEVMKEQERREKREWE